MEGDGDRRALLMPEPELEAESDQTLSAGAAGVAFLGRGTAVELEAPPHWQLSQAIVFIICRGLLK